MRGYRKSYGNQGNKIDEPTPAQIRKRCREIQSTWSEHVERTRRGVGEYGSVQTKVVPVGLKRSPFEDWQFA